MLTPPIAPALHPRRQQIKAFPQAAKPHRTSPPSPLRSTSSTSRQYNKISVFEDPSSLHMMLCSCHRKQRFIVIFSSFLTSACRVLVPYRHCPAYKSPAPGFVKRQATAAHLPLLFVCFRRQLWPRFPLSFHVLSTARRLVNSLCRSHLSDLAFSISALVVLLHRSP